MNEQGYLVASHWAYITGGAAFSAGNDFASVAPVPEPTSMLLLGTGLLAAWRARRA